MLALLTTEIILDNFNPLFHTQGVSADTQYIFLIVKMFSFFKLIFQLFESLKCYLFIY